MPPFVRKVYNKLPPSIKGLLRRNLRKYFLGGTPYWNRKEQKEKNKQSIRIGVVGAGAYAQHHLKVLSSLRNVKIASICTRGGPKVYKVANRYSINKIYTDLDQFISQSDVDAFVIVVPILETKNITLKCLSSGKPVLLEKPAGLSSADTAEMAERADQCNTFGMVAMNRRFWSVIEHGLAALADCVPLRGVMLEVPENITALRNSKNHDERIYNDWMFAQSVHAIDLFRYIGGDIVSVYNLAKPNREMRNAAASFASLVEFEGGIIGSVVALWDTLPTWRLKIVAEHGWVEFEPLEKGWFFDGKEKKIPLKLDKVDIDFRLGLYAQDLHFIEAVRSNRKPALPASLLPDAYKTNKLIEQILGGTGCKMA